MAPLAIRVGMSSEQYWLGDPAMLTEYYRAWLEGERQRMSDMDLAAWMFGHYNMEAHSVVLSTAFGKKGARKPEYPSEPQYYKEFMDKRSRERAEKREQERKLMEMKRRFDAMVAAARR